MSYNNKTKTLYVHREMLEELQFAASKESMTITRDTCHTE